MASDLNPQQSTRSTSPFSISNMSTVDVTGMLKRRWKMVAIGGAVGIVLSMFYFMLATVKYESSARVLVMKKDAKLPTKGVESNGESDPRVSEDLLSTHMQIVSSRAIVQNALESHGLDKLDSILSELDDDETPVDYVIDHLTVSRGGTGQAKTAHVLNLSFRHTNDEESKAIVEAIVDSYRKFLGSTFQNVSTEAVTLIAKAKNELGAELEEAEDKYQKFREEAPLLWNGDESANTNRANFEALESALSDLNKDYAEAEARLEVVKFGLAELERIGAPEMQQLALLDENHIARLELLVKVDQGAADTESFQSLQPARMENARAEYDGLLRLMLKEKTLLMDLGDEHPQVRETRQQIAQAKEFIKQKDDESNIGDKVKLTPKAVIDAYLALLNYDLLAIKKRQQQVEALAEKERLKAKAMVQHEMGAERLRNEVARKQEMFDATIKTLKEINVVKDYGGFITEVIEPAEIGEQVWPKVSWCALIGLMLGLVAGAGTAAGVELSDKTFHDPGEVRDSLGLPVLTHIPRLSEISSQKAANAEYGEFGLDPSLIVFHSPRSREAETFRALRTSVFFASRGTSRQVVACTSANPGDGKTTLATNLAVSIAQSGRKVLIMDCDLRRPRVHQIFNVDPTVGVANVLTGEHEPADAIKPTEINNLSAMPCGPIAENPSELLTSASFQQLLDLLRDQYDFIVIDTPPVLAVADPCIVAQQADSVIMTVRTSQDNRPQTIEAKEMLTRVDARIIGVVVNVADDNRGKSYGYALAYGYGYGYTYTGGYGTQASSVYFDREKEDMAKKANAETDKPAPQPPTA